MSHCFRDFVLIYNSLPMHTALVCAVLHVRTLFEKMRARVDLQIARYYIVLQNVPAPLVKFSGGGAGAPGAPVVPTPLLTTLASWGHVSFTADSCSEILPPPPPPHTHTSSPTAGRTWVSLHIREAVSLTA